MRLRGTQQPVVVTAKRLIECNQPCTDRKCHVALKERKALNFAFTPSRILQSRRQSLRAMQQSYAAICLISTRKVPRHGLDFRVTASLKSQCHCLSAQFAPLWRAARPRSERSVGGPVIICLLFLLPTFMARGPSGPAFHCLCAQLWRAARAGQLIIAFLCNLPPLWRTARPRSERSVGSPVIICLLFHLPTFMARGPSGPAFHCLSAQFSPVMARGPSGPAYHCLLCNLPPLWRAARPRSERSVGGPVIFCLFVSLAHLYGARPELASFSLPFCPIMARGPSGPAYHCLSVRFAPVMAHGPSSERALRRQPSYHLPFVSFAHLYGARPERASFSLPFCPILLRYGARPERASLSLPSVQFAPVMARGPSSERALRRRPSYHLPFDSLPTFMARSPSGPAFIAFLPNFPPLWHATGPRGGRSVGGPVIICLLFHLPTFMASGPSGPAFNCLSAQFSPVMARGPSRPADRLPFCSICPRFGARLERASLSMPCFSL